MRTLANTQNITIDDSNEVLEDEFDRERTTIPIRSPNALGGPAQSAQTAARQVSTTSATHDGSTAAVIGAASEFLA